MTTQISLIIALSLMLFRPQQDCAKARLVTRGWYSAINKKVGQVTESKEAKLFIRNTSKKDIKLPQWFCESSADAPDTEVYLEIMQKAENGTYVEAEKGSPDIDYFTVGRKFDIIRPGREAEFTTQLDLIYELDTKGKYKVRAILKLKSYIDCEEITTEWHEFEVR